MRRREFIRVIGLSAAWPLMAHAQQSKRNVKIGVLWHAGNAKEEKIYLDALMEDFRDLGYVEGENTEFIHRFPAENADRFALFAQELVDHSVDVAIATTLNGAVALKRITKTTPIVFVAVPDPLGAGLIASLAHPGGNLTGLSFMSIDLCSKRLGLLKEAIPSLRSVALLQDAVDQVTSKLYRSSYSKAAASMGLELLSVEVPTPPAIDTTFSAIAIERVGAAIVHGSMMANEGVQVGASALIHHIPTLSPFAEKVGFGLLMSYGQDLFEFFRKTASLTDKILKGAKPGDLPVEQPTRLELVINLKVAKTLGLTIPPTLLASADEVIE